MSLHSHSNFCPQCYGIVGLLVASSWFVVLARAEQNHVAENLHQQAVAVLRDVMRTEQRWIKVHAAEALLGLGYPEEVRKTFFRELELHGNIPKYRIGIWRVLARACSQERRKQWVTRIRNAFLDETGPDQVHAVESLAKLNYRIEEPERKFFDEASQSEDAALAIFAIWALASSQEGNNRDAVVRMLESSDVVTRLRAALVLSHLPNLSTFHWEKLREATKAEKLCTPAYAYLVAASFIISTDLEDVEEAALYREKLIRLTRHRNSSDRRVVCGAFAKKGVATDLPLVADLLTHDDPDVRVAAADAVLHINRRTNTASAERLE